MGLNGIDLAVIVGYLAAVTFVGLRFRSPEKTVRGYCLTNDRVSWWAIALSIAVAETSTLTIISVPGLAYEHDFRFLPFVIGYMIGRGIVAFLLVPHSFRGVLVTAYQLIARRFGERPRLVTEGLFLVTRAAAQGVRVLAVAIVVRI